MNKNISQPNKFSTPFNGTDASYVLLAPDAFRSFEAVRRAFEGDLHELKFH